MEYIKIMDNNINIKSWHAKELASGMTEARLAANRVNIAKALIVLRKKWQAKKLAKIAQQNLATQSLHNPLTMK